ncbi:MAG TPA: MHYT domain-containing protein [Thermoanaerobaculia bacterium]|nr:MHYT domain-containing protein [Thermoanaerobaculia bacterium]
METVLGSYQPVLVSLSFIISVVGSFAALRLAKLIPLHEPDDRLPWILGASFALAGGGIWSMHFIAMLAFDMGMPVSYDIPVTALSLVLAWAVTGIGFFVVSRGASSPLRLGAAGVLMGLGVATMHYTGMAAMRMAATIAYDPTLLVLSVVIAIVASTAALWLVFHLERLWHMLVAAVIMGVAVCGMHYTGMAAASFRHDATIVIPQSSAVAPEFLAYSIFLVSLVILVLGIAFGRVETFEEDLVLE